METEDRIARWTDERLLREYRENMRHCFNRIFGHNCRAEQNLVAAELIRRGITSMPNLFGPIEISSNW